MAGEAMGISAEMRVGRRRGLATQVTGVAVTDRHHGRTGKMFAVTRVHLSNDIASHVVSMDQSYLS